MADGKTISIKRIAEKIAESVLEDGYISKESLIEKTILNLKIWHKLTNRPADYDKVKTDKGRLVFTIEKKDIELEFWRGKAREMAGQEKTEKLYNELSDILIETGYEIRKEVSDGG